MLNQTNVIYLKVLEPINEVPTSIRVGYMSKVEREVLRVMNIAPSSRLQFTSRLQFSK